MRIQDTDKILKESRMARNAVSHQHDDEGVVSKLWRNVSNLPNRVMGMFRRDH